MSQGIVDGYELAARTRGVAFDIRSDTDVLHYHGRKNPAANTLGRWRVTWAWDPRLEKPVMTAMVDVATAANLNGQTGP